MTGSNGSKLALIEYEGVPPSTPTGDPLHFLAVIASDGDHVALATLTATADEFANVRPKIEPYLLTLQTT